MKHVSLLLIFALVLTSAPTGWAQGSSDELARLQKEIARRELIDRDESTPADLKVTNRANLERARKELINAVQARIAALQAYVETLGDSMTAAERVETLDSLKELSSAANSGSDGPDPGLGNGRIVPSKLNGTLRAHNLKSIVPFEIISPSDQYPTKLQEIEVFVQLAAKATEASPLTWKVKNGRDESINGSLIIDAGRTAEKVVVPLREGVNEVTISAPSNPSLKKRITVIREPESGVVGAVNSSSASVTQNATAAATATATPTPEPSAYTRAIFGLEQAAAASANPEQKLFIEFNLTAPLFNGEEEESIKAPVWLWLNPRITSLPQQLKSSVADFSTASNFVSPFNSGKVNEVVQGFEFLGGIEKRLWVSGPRKSGFGATTELRMGLSLVAGAGMLAPFSSQKTLQTFKVNQTVVDRFPDAQGKEFIAFVSGERNRFFRQYYGGLRIKSYFVKSGKDELDDIFPGIIDITFGQNEAVTGGDLHGGVVRLDGIYPFSFAGKRLFIFGSALMKLSRPKISAPIILQPTDGTIAVPGPNVFIQQVPPQDIDHYRIGLGIDLTKIKG